ncbi:MAG: hypothetical protein ABL921_03885 [Pirellula sp.]
MPRATAVENATSITRLESVDRRSFKVSREDNHFLCWPAAGTVPQLLSQNQAILSERALPAWIAELRQNARIDAIQSAQTFTAAYTDRIPSQAALHQNLQLIVSGHQPELFHPGVWFKNFLISKLAAENRDAISLHVLIDHDEARSHALRVPHRIVSHDRGTTTAEFFQEFVRLPISPADGPRLPWDATSTRDTQPADWESAIDRISMLLSSCSVRNPILQSRASLMQLCIANCANFGHAFSRFRHLIELDHGVKNLEVPIGRLCNGHVFGNFFRHCVLNAAELWQIHNKCRSDYRRQRAIRNPTQPVLELLRHRDCVELPFWIYRSKLGFSADRKRLWLAPNGSDSVLLCDSPEPLSRSIECEMPVDLGSWDVRWSELASQGICIRPRALMTTLYLRCFLADLFVHGIGGGIYDQLTDEIIRRWLRIDPPAFVVGSASLHLPIATSHVAGVEHAREQCDRELQLMRSAPERYLDPNNASHRQLLTQHVRLRSSMPHRGQKKQWHQQMLQARHQIESAILERYRDARIRKASIVKADQQRAILQSREYSIGLFPESDITTRLNQLAEAAVSQID